MAEFKLNFDTAKFNLEKIGLILKELEAVAVVEENRITFDENNQKQSQKIRDILDKYTVI